MSVLVLAFMEPCCPSSGILYFFLPFVALWGVGWGGYSLSGFSLIAAGFFYGIAYLVGDKESTGTGKFP